MSVTTVYLEKRRSGRSTAIALEAIAEAIKNPGEKVHLKDHFDHGNKFLLSLVQELVQKMGLESFTYYPNGNNPSIACTFEPLYTDVRTGDIYKKIR